METGSPKHQPRSHLEAPLQESLAKTQIKGYTKIYSLDLKKIYLIQATPKWVYVILLGNDTTVSQHSTPKHQYL